MLETDSTNWTITLPLHQTCPTWIHTYTQPARKQVSAFAGHERDTFNIQFQTRQSRTKLNIPYLKHHICGFNPKPRKNVGKITSLTSLPAAGRNKPSLLVFLHQLEQLGGSENIRKKKSIEITFTGWTLQFGYSPRAKYCVYYFDTTSLHVAPAGRK